MILPSPNSRVGVVGGSQSLNSKRRLVRKRLFGDLACFEVLHPHFFLLIWRSVHQASPNFVERAQQQSTTGVLRSSFALARQSNYCTNRNYVHLSKLFRII